MNPLDIDLKLRTVWTGIAAVAMGIVAMAAKALDINVGIETAPELLIIAGFAIIYDRMGKKKAEAMKNGD